MYRTNSWTTLPEGIRFKKQNYTNSCVMASYQNLCANLSSSHQNLFTGTFSWMEQLEYDYMLRNCRCDIGHTSPEQIHIHDFFRKRVDPLRYSLNTIRNQDNLTIETLYIFGQTHNYRTGYILFMGNGNAYHAYALFKKKINDIDRYILLDPVNDYIASDFPYYAQACDRGKAAFKDLHLGVIYGGVQVIF